jgi:hypothetical protein
MELTQAKDDAARRAAAAAGHEFTLEDQTGSDHPPVTAGRHA